MSTYYNKKSEEIPIGSEFKLNVHMDPVDGKHLGDDDVDFTCSFYAKEEVILEKSQMIEVDENNYVAPLNSEALGLGTIGMYDVTYSCFFPSVNSTPFVAGTVTV
jgi:hypothetical protein